MEQKRTEDEEGKKVSRMRGNGNEDEECEEAEEERIIRMNMMRRMMRREQ